MNCKKKHTILLIYYASEEIPLLLKHEFFEVTNFFRSNIKGRDEIK